MRIGLAVDSFAPHLTGIGRYTLELFRGLRTHSAVDNLACFRFDRWVSDPEAYLSDSPPRSNIPIPRMFRRWMAQWQFRSRLFHGTNFFLPAKVEAGIVTVHDLSVLLYPEAHPQERVKIFERDFQSSLERARHVITDSETVRQEVISHFGLDARSVTAVPLGLAGAFRPASPPSIAPALARYGLTPGHYVLSVATLEPRKRIDAAIMAHGLMCERHRRDIPLILVGMLGWRNDHLLELVEREKRKGRLRVLGFVPESDLPALYTGAALFLYPSIYEGFGLPPLEAMACGVPTLVANRSCMPEVTQGAAGLIDPDDHAGFAERIAEALEDQAWRASAVQDGLTVASRYSWDRCVNATVEVYRLVLGE